MDTTTLYNRWWQLRQDVIAALTGAVKANGGSYEFIDTEAEHDDIDDWEEDAGLPLVIAEDATDGTCPCYVTSLFVEGDRLHIYGFTQEGDDISYTSELLYLEVPGYLQILESIPEPCLSTKEP